MRSTLKRSRKRKESRNNHLFYCKFILFALNFTEDSHIVSSAVSTARNIDASFRYHHTSRSNTYNYDGSQRPKRTRTPINDASSSSTNNDLTDLLTDSETNDFTTPILFDENEKEEQVVAALAQTDELSADKEMTEHDDYESDVYRLYQERRTNRRRISYHTRNFKDKPEHRAATIKARSSTTNDKNTMQYNESSPKPFVSQNSNIDSAGRTTGNGRTKNTSATTTTQQRWPTAGGGNLKKRSQEQQLNQQSIRYNSINDISKANTNEVRDVTSSSAPRAFITPRNSYSTSTGTVTHEQRTGDNSRQRVSQSPPSHQQQRAHQPPPSTTTSTPWIRNFLSSRRKDALLSIPRDYLADGFNLVQLAPIVERIGLMEDEGETQQGYSSSKGSSSADTLTTSSSFPYYKAALRLILSEEEQQASKAVQRAAEALYLLVHARYVISPRGLDAVRRIFKQGSTIDGQSSTSSSEPAFGRCPRFGCRGMPLLPYGDSDFFDFNASLTTRAKRYCCCCGEKLFLWDSKADGCAWGPSFCHLFLMTCGQDIFPELIAMRDAEEMVAKPEKPERNLVPQVFGFKLHPSCKVRYPPRDTSHKPVPVER